MLLVMLLAHVGKLQTGVHRWSPKQVLLKILQYSQEKTCVEASL